MRVRCRTNREGSIRHALTLRALYEVLGIEAGDYRIIDDSGSPVLFSPKLFRVVDASRPEHWRSEILDGVEYAYALELGKAGFFEDYHDGDPDAVRRFNRYINQHLRLTDAA